MPEMIIDQEEVMDTGYESQELVPPKGSEGVGIAVIDMLDQILQYREELKIAEKFNRYYKLRRNKHWKNKNKKISLVSANLLGAHHSKTVNMLTDNNPTFNAIQAGEMDQDGEEKLSLLVKTTDSWWTETEQQHAFEESVSTGELYGMVGEFMSFDQDINFPEGDVDTETLDPLYFSCFPPKCRKVEKSEAMLRWYPMTVREARRKWPKAAADLQGDETLLSEIGDERHDENSKSTSQKRTVLSSLTRWLSGSSQSSGDTEAEELFVVEAWVKDYTQDEHGEPLYPGNIRCIKVANAGEVVLDDAYNPSLNTELGIDINIKNYLFARFPFSMTQSVTDTTSPFGFADFEQLEQLNVEMNKTMSQFTLFKNKAFRLKLVNPKDSGVTNEELDDLPGVVNPTNHLVAQSLRYIDPPKLSTDIPMALSLYKDMFHEIAGSFQDATQGQKAGSEVIAAKAIAMLLEEAARMARGKIRNYSKMLRERGRMFLALAQSWYDTDRYITFQKQGKDVTQVVNREVLQIPGKINVVNGSTMPVSLIQRREEAISLFKMGVIDQEELLKSFDWDNRKDVVARMQQGPLGQFLEKMGMIGVPKQILEAFKKLGQWDEKEIERGLKEGKVQPFMQMIQAIMQQGQQQPEKPDPEMIKLQIEGRKAQADITEKQAKAQAIMADIELTKQKIETEIVERQVKQFGMKLDQENIRIEKAKAVANIQNMQQTSKLTKVKTASDIAERAHNEREGVATREHQQSEDAQNRQERKLQMRDDKGGYDERGMKSNNEGSE